LAETWEGVLTNPTDVKELIPEFFQVPVENEQGEIVTFLTNHRHLDLGMRQNMTKVQDVQLPPWAKDDVDFFKKHTEALESEHVSSQLHHWIDLIFGYKQRGEEAIKADNLFYYLTYEGAVDIESITDPVKRAAIEVQINEFGQTPKQLFKIPHPRRNKKGEIGIERVESLIGSQLSINSRTNSTDSSSDFIVNPNNNSLSGNMISSRNNSNNSSSSVNLSVNLNNNKINNPNSASNSKLSSNLSVNTSENVNNNNSKSDNTVNNTPLSAFPPSGGSWSGIEKMTCTFSYKIHKDAVSGLCFSVDGSTIYSVSQDSTLKIYSLAEKRQIRSINVSELALSSCVLSRDGKSIIIGSWDNNVYIYSIDYGRILDTISGHDDAVSSLANNTNNSNALYTASWDSTIKVWKCGLMEGDNKKSVLLAELVEHESEVNTLDINSDYLVSGGSEGSLIFWSVNSIEAGSVGRIHAHNDVINAVKFTQNGKLVLTAGNDGFLKVFEVIGGEVISFDAGEPIKSILTDGQFVLGGTASGNIKLWELLTGQLIRTFTGHTGAVTSLSCFISGQQRVLASASEDCSIRIWNIPNP